MVDQPDEGVGSARIARRGMLAAVGTALFALAAQRDGASARRRGRKGGKRNSNSSSSTSTGAGGPGGTGGAGGNVVISGS